MANIYIDLWTVLFLYEARIKIKLLLNGARLCETSFIYTSLLIQNECSMKHMLSSDLAAL